MKGSEMASLLNLVLSGLAVLVATVALTWTVIRSRWERPVVIVTGRSRIVPVPGAPDTRRRFELSVTAANIGEKPVTVLDVAWAWVSSHGTDMSSIGLQDDSGPDVPVRLEPHDSKTWLIYAPVDGMTMGDAHPRVEVVQRTTWRERRANTKPVRQVHGVLRSLSEPNYENHSLDPSPTFEERQVDSAHGSRLLNFFRGSQRRS